MSRKALIAALAMTAVALGAPVAHADTPTFDCNFTAVWQSDVTGQYFEGAAQGYVVHAGDAGATIRCYIAVNGREASSTPTGTGLTAGRLTYPAGDWDVTLHAEFCTSHGCDDAEYAVHHSPIPGGVVHRPVWESVDAQLQQLPVDWAFDCYFGSFRQDAVSHEFKGAAFGYLVHPSDDAGTIRCYVAVNGVDVSSTVVLPSPGFSLTAGELTYSAGPTDVVTFHAEICEPIGCFVHDYETFRTQVPPQEVFDALLAVMELLRDTQVFQQFDPAICPLVGGLAGRYGPVVIDPTGDISVGGTDVWDCPPYDSYSSVPPGTLVELIT